MIVSTEQVVQPIDRGRRARFEKSVVHVAGPEPLAMVRKRAIDARGRVSESQPAVVLVHGFAQNRRAFHLPSRSFANHLAASGFDVFNLDLRGHGRSRERGARHAPSVDAYILEDFPAAVDEVRSLVGDARLFAIGHSMGGIVVGSGSAQRPGCVSGIVALAPPYRFARGSLTLTMFAKTLDALRWVRPHAPSRFRLPIATIATQFRLLRTAWNSPVLPIPVRVWHPRSMEVRTLREFLSHSFDHATLGTVVQMTRLGLDGSLDELAGGGEHLQPFEALDVPLLVLAGAYDLLAPPASVRPMYDRSHARDRSYRVLPFGHADLIHGRDAPQLVWPLVTSWLRERV